jgi:hypothetical protein
MPRAADCSKKEHDLDFREPRTNGGSPERVDSAGLDNLTYLEGSHARA